MNQLTLNSEQIKEVFNLSQGIYSPLNGFLRQKDFVSVVKRTRLANGKVWPIPIILDISKKQVAKLIQGSQVELIDKIGQRIALLKEIEFYPYDKQELCLKVFQTNDQNHPGVEQVYQMSDYLLGGELVSVNQELLKICLPDLILPFYFSPEQSKRFFKQKGWKRISAFQTRNVPHRSHEALQQAALTKTDGLFIQPVIGKKKRGDFKDELILQAYQLLVNKYHQEKAFLGILPLIMRYAGPREAVFHALIRKNFGCTHMIIGRDHAGVGNYYHPYAAQKIFNQFKPIELGIKILKFNCLFYCPVCDKLVTKDECFHDQAQEISGTQFRQMIQAKQEAARQMVRSEVADLLFNHPDPFVN